MSSQLDEEVQFKIGGVFVSHEIVNQDGHGTETDTDVDIEEDDAVILPKCDETKMMYSEQDVDAKINRDQEKSKKQWKRKKQSYLAQMSLMQQKIDKLEQKKAEFDAKNKEIDGIICEFEKTAERVAEEKESQIYDLVQERQRLQTLTNELELKNNTVAQKLQGGQERVELLDSQHRERLEDLQRAQEKAKQKIQADMADHQRVIDSASTRMLQHQQTLAEGAKTKENLESARKKAQASLDSVRTDLKNALQTVKSQREGAQNALLELRQNAMVALKDHKALTKQMPALEKAKSDWSSRHQAACERNAKMQEQLEQDKQKLSALELAKKTAVLEAYRWGEDLDKQSARLKAERAKTRELQDIRNQLDQQKAGKA